MLTNVIDLILNSYASLYLSIASFIGSYGVAAIILAITVSVIMIYPLRWAHKVSAKEQSIMAALLPNLQRIKQESSGAEQHRRISLLYSSYGYHPIYAVRTLAGLLIQVPALVLTYFMFDRLVEITGVPFLLVQDLGQPDGLLKNEGNALPFIMTTINLLAALFTPNISKSELLKSAIVSVLIFFLLYDVKSALLIFWTANNVILLAKNIHSYRRNKTALPLDLYTSWQQSKSFLLKPEVAYFFGTYFIYSAVALTLVPLGPNSSVLKGFTALAILGLSGIALLHLVQRVSGALQQYPLTNCRSDTKFSSALSTNFLLALLPMAIVVQILSENKNILSLETQVGFFTVVAVALLLVVWIIPTTIERLSSRNFCMSPMASVFMVTLLSMHQGIFFTNSVSPDYALILAAFTALLYLMVYLYLMHSRIVKFGSCVMFIVSLFFLLNESLTANDKQTPIAGLKAINIEPKNSLKKTPDIFLLTYDSYVTSEAMNNYSIDNSEQEQFLRDVGFTLYPATYSVGWSSRDSMTSMLDIKAGGNGGSTSGDAFVPVLLSENGYETYGVLNPWMYNRRPSYDFYYPEIPPNPLGALVETIAAGTLDYVFVMQRNTDWSEKKFKIEKHRVLAKQAGPPRFLYAHSSYPGHSNLTGTCRDNEWELFGERVDNANQEMKGDLAAILSNNRDAIIIVNGDHGPMITGDCTWLENYTTDQLTRPILQDRFGAFLAIRWPSEPKGADRNIKTLHDTFAAVLSYLFENNHPLLTEPSHSTMRRPPFPSGLVEDGIIKVGPHAGEPLYKNGR